MDKKVGRVRQVLGMVLVILLLSVVIAPVAGAANSNGTHSRKNADKIHLNNIYFEDED